ncbi:MAG: glycosyltransferase family 39 protein [Fimbriimonadaceae bacterium]
MNVALSAAISNDPLLITLCSACLGSLLWAKDRDWNITFLLFSTVFAGLAMLTKSTGILIMIPLLVAAVWAAIKNRKFSGFIVVLAVLIPSPWWQKTCRFMENRFCSMRLAKRGHRSGSRPRARRLQ